MSSKSTILAMQEILFNATDPNIITKISADQTTIYASNITEEIFQYLSIATNNPGYSNGYMYLTDIEVYLDNNLFPTTIYGLFPIVYERIAYSDTLAFIENKNVNQPFINGFQGGVTIGQLVDQLSSLSRSTPDTYGKVKKFVLVFDPRPAYAVSTNNKTASQIGRTTQSSTGFGSNIKTAQPTSATTPASPMEYFQDI